MYVLLYVQVYTVFPPKDGTMVLHTLNFKVYAEKHILKHQLNIVDQMSCTCTTDALIHY